MLIVNEFKRICLACPSSWEGQTENDTPVFIRYLHGCSSIGIKGSERKSGAIYENEISGADYGEPLSGFLHFN